MEVNNDGCKRQPGGITAHVKKVLQDQKDITTLIMSEAQMLELLSVLSVALRSQNILTGITSQFGDKTALKSVRQIRRVKEATPRGIWCGRQR